MRAIMSFKKNLHEFREFAHEFVVVLHPPRGVYEDHVHLLLLAVRNRELGHLPRVLQIAFCEWQHAHRGAPLFQQRTGV